MTRLALFALLLAGCAQKVAQVPIGEGQQTVSVQEKKLTDEQKIALLRAEERPKL